MLKKKIIKEHIILIDSYFPQKSFDGWRAKLISDFLEEFPNFKFYFSLEQTSLFKDFLKLLKKMFYLCFKKEKFEKRERAIDYRLTEFDFLTNKESYCEKYPRHKERILYLNKKARYQLDLAILIFINTVYGHISFLEKNKIPFLFILYPGGGFHINSRISDKKLKRVCGSKYFKKVLVTNVFTKRYLLRKKICLEEEIVQLKYQRADMDKSKIKIKKKYLKDKSSFDLAFVAFKYMDKGLDKGYDLFIDVATRLSKK